jgi:hypothetical protein
VVEMHHGRIEVEGIQHVSQSLRRHPKTG